MKKAIIILSGGMDSAVLLAKVLKEEYEVETLSFDYGSKHNDEEYKHALMLCEYYKVKNQRIALPFVNDLFKSDLLKSGGDIPEGHYEDESMQRTVVPNRNAIMLSIAVGYAESVGAGVVFYGPHAGDHAIYDDCRDTFVIPFDKAMQAASGGKVVIKAPFLALTKRDIGLIGKELDVPFEKTYSCYKGGEKHCGKCVAKDTEILMGDYSKKLIQDIVVGDIILSYDKKKKLIIPNKVVQVHSNGKQVIYNAKFGRNILRCTDSHKIARYTSSKNVEFAVAKKFSSYKHSNAFVVPFWKDLTPVDLKAFWTGWLSGVVDGDGSFASPKSYPRERFLGVPVKEVIFAKLIKENVKKYFNIDMRFVDHKSSSIVKAHSKMINVCCSITRDVKAVENQIKSYEKTLDFWKGWLRGIIDTDGGIDRFSYRIYQSKPVIVAKIRRALKQLNLPFTEYVQTKEDHNSNSKNKLHANYDAYTFVLSSGHLTNVMTGNIKTFKYKEFSFLLKFLTRPVFDSLKVIGEDDTYDLTTEIGNYFADGFLIHNCGTCTERKEALAGFDPTQYLA
jgi:7-cyano-7-deazaguanine synthase